jgi:hypothetical protein
MEVANLLGQKLTWTLKQGVHAYTGKHSFSLCLIKHLTMKACGEAEVKPRTF